MGSRRRKTTTTRRREKREEKREKREESRRTPRGRQRSRNEAARGGPTLSDTAAPAQARSIDGSNRCILRVDRDCVERIHRAYAVAMALPSPRPQAGWKKAGRREKREERREHMAASSNHCISTVSRGHLEKVLKIRNGHPKIFTAYLRCPVTTSKSAQKYFSSLLPKV
jgi:hypothetical protein